MDKTSRLTWLAALRLWSAALSLFLAATLLVSIGNSEPRQNGSTTIPYKVVEVYPHDANAFCQGLVYDGKTLYESTGLKVSHRCDTST